MLSLNRSCVLNRLAKSFLGVFHSALQRKTHMLYMDSSSITSLFYTSLESDGVISLVFVSIHITHFTTILTSASSSRNQRSFEFSFGLRTDVNISLLLCNTLLLLCNCQTRIITFVLILLLMDLIHVKFLFCC